MNLLKKAILKTRYCYW